MHKNIKYMYTNRSSVFEIIIKIAWTEIGKTVKH